MAPIPEYIHPPFPIFLDLTGATVLVVGNSDIAARRAEAVLRAGAKVMIAADKIEPPIQHLLVKSEVTWLGRSFEPNDVNGKRLVMVATENAALSTQISNISQAAGIPINVADSLSLCTFIMPAIVDRAPITAAISSGGVAPVLSRRVKTAIEAAVPTGLGALAIYAGHIRARVNRTIGDPRARRKFWQHFADGPIASYILAKDEEAAEREVENAISTLTAGDTLKTGGEFIVLGTGDGDPDLLSLRALRLMQHGAVIVHEVNVSTAILNLCRKDADRIAENDLNTAYQRALKLAEGGLTVLWITGGSPAEPDDSELRKKGIVVTKVAAAS